MKHFKLKIYIEENKKILGIVSRTGNKKFYFSYINEDFRDDSFFYNYQYYYYSSLHNKNIYIISEGYPQDSLECDTFFIFGRNRELDESPMFIKNFKDIFEERKLYLKEDIN